MGKIRQKLFSLLTAVILVISIGMPFTGQTSAEGILTVQQAIENNSGTGTVEGYIVAHTTGTNSYDFEAPFKDDYNFALADSPDEKDASKILPVQIKTTFRAEFGLMSNPDLIGKKVQVTGSLEAYFTVPGLKSPTAMQFADGSGGNPGDPGEPEPPAVTNLKIHDIQGEGHIDRKSVV